ncbi:hypothetical protein TWF481_010357 [Arthrobotrys musiformis]|uniref:Uncharacterized protein n=1 Tax=Arthrobotrys musiformis TaxID=47236 RepID=A0AAV9W1X5_9PEZI
MAETIEGTIAPPPQDSLSISLTDVNGSQHAVQTPQPTSSDVEHQAGGLCVAAISGRRPARGFVRAIGRYGIVIGALGTLILAGTSIFLVIFWQKSIQAQSGLVNGPVHDILRKDWATRVVTITSVFIRLAISFQASLAVAMIASVFLESVGCRPAEIAEFSIIRCINSGPPTAILLMKRRFRSMTSVFYATIVLLSLLSGILSQLTSTVLLTDFGPARILGNSSQISVAYGVASEFELVSNVARSLPRAFPRFAEFTEAGNNSEQVVDTGSTFRAYLPIESAAQRSSLREYSGPAELINSRVVCIRPKITNFRVEDVDSGISVEINGNFDWDDTALIEKCGCNPQQVYFSCAVPINVGPPGKWAISICDQQIYGWIYSGINHTITASAKEDGIEPQLVWDKATRSYSVNDIVNMLGAGQTRATNQERGIMNLQEDGEWKTPYGDTSGSEMEEEFSQAYTYIGRALGDIFSESDALVPEIYPYPDPTLHRVHSIMFNSIITSTGNPALALQALLTTLQQMLFLEWLPVFTVSGSCSMVFSFAVNAPVRQTGLLIIIGNNLLHFLLFTASFLLFFRKTSVSLLGDSWSAVSQIVSPDTLPLVRGATELTDKEVSIWLRKDDAHLRKTIVCYLADVDRSEARYEPETAKELRRRQKFHTLGLRSDGRLET